MRDYPTSPYAMMHKRIEQKKRNEQKIYKSSPMPYKTILAQKRGCN